MAWTLCDLEQQSRRASATNATSATNADMDQGAAKTSRIKYEHIVGLNALNPGPTPCSSFSTPSVADSVESAEFTETNPAALRGLGIDASDKDAPGTVMNDTADESEVEEISACGNFAVFMAQVIFFFHFFFEIQDHPVTHNLMFLK